MTKEDFKNNIFSLSERLYPMVYRMLRTRPKTEDAIQEIMLKLWTKRHKIEQHPNLPGLVVLTARNYCIDLLRKKNLYQYSAHYQLESLSSSNGMEQLEWKDLNTTIRNILKELPEKQAEVLIMRDLDGFEFIEIATALEVTVEHVRVLLSRARKYVSVQLEKKYSYERS